MVLKEGIITPIFKIGEKDEVTSKFFSATPAIIGKSIRSKYTNQWASTRPLIRSVSQSLFIVKLQIMGFRGVALKPFVSYLK